MLVKPIFDCAVDVDDCYDLENISHPADDHFVEPLLTLPSFNIGKTISLLDWLSQAMWPGNFSTSPTNCV